MVMIMARKYNIEFRNVEELYNRIKPALYSKVKELNRLGINYVKEVDIWNYLSEHSWKESENLCLSGMVSNIMDLDSDTIKNYCLEILKNQERDVNTEEGDLLWKIRNLLQA